MEDREAKRALVCIEILRRYEGLLMAMPWQMLETCMWAVLERPRRDTNRGDDDQNVDQIVDKDMRARYFCVSNPEIGKSNLGLDGTARFPLLGLLLSLGCWVRARQKPSKDPAVKNQNGVEKVSARDPARDPTTNLARKAQGVAAQRCGPGQPHKVCNTRRWSQPFSPTSRQQSPGRL